MDAMTINTIVGIIGTIVGIIGIALGVIGGICLYNSKNITKDGVRPH